MNMQTAQRNYDAQSEPEAGETMFDDIERCFNGLIPHAEDVLDAVAQYLCNSRDEFSKNVLLRTLTSIGDKAQSEWVKRNEAADADAREGV